MIKSLTAIILILSQVSFAADAKNKELPKRQPAATGQFFCTWATGNEITLESEMKDSCDIKQPFSISSVIRNDVVRYTYCCTAK